MKVWWQKMENDSLMTTIQSIVCSLISFVIMHLPELQAFITFSLTVVFLIYKIREAKAKAEIVENDERKRH